MQEIKDTTEILANVATFAGIVSLIFLINTYLVETKRQRREAEMATYLSLNDDYVNWLRLCFDNMDLTVPDVIELGGISKNDEWKRERLAFGILTCMFEKAYFMYYDHANEFRSAQWQGWSEYMDNYCKTSKYAEYFESGGGQQFDWRFVWCMLCRLRHLKGGGAVQPATSVSSDPPRA
jgi:hypothetical protein